MAFKTIDLSAFSCKSNTIGKIINYFDEDKLEEYFKNKVFFPAENTKNILCLPVLNKDIFVIISLELPSNGILLLTDDRQLSITTNKLPVATRIVDLNYLWQCNISKGQIIDPEQIFYWCENNRTSIVQRLEWRTNHKGPLVLPNKYIRLFDIKYLSEPQVILHDLLDLQQVPEALLCQFDELDQAVEPVQ